MMQPLGSIGSVAQDFALTWLPVMFFGLMCVVVVLLWRTVKLMPKVKPMEIAPGSSSSVTWAEVAGLDEAKAELQEVVEFLRDPKRFRKLGARVPKGILLEGFAFLLLENEVMEREDIERLVDAYRAEKGTLACERPVKELEPGRAEIAASEAPRNAE
jgi:hypothetical protein